ncbi:MAG TPA: prepilin-type N-terminal cleavage/methylation domain-containing protein [Candidatus Paceibacterota bacterium]|nr:prepilin-type N-terminal cleavage/methylation domain-containing protein [Candidatus Paceibacterota bacterium]
MNSTQRKGFTLIEILIVVAIIAILASVVLVGLGPTQQAGRDARRISDLSEVQNGLELYYNECGYYPGTKQTGSSCGNFSEISSWANLTTALEGTTAIAITSVPNDPTAGHNYQYGTNGTGSLYVLEATLENPNNSAFTNYNGASFPTVTGVLSCTGTGDYCKTL